MFEVKIVTACRSQVRRKKNMKEPYKGPAYITQTLHHIWHSDIPWDKVKVYMDTQNFDYEGISEDQNEALRLAKESGAKVMYNAGGEFVSNSIEALKHELNNSEPYLILLEDDVQVSKTIITRLTKWLDKYPEVKFATLYGVSGFQRLTINPDQFWGAQALLIAKEIISDIIYWTEHYNELGKGFPDGGCDLKYSRIVGKKLGLPIYNHVPAVVEHLGIHSSWPGGYVHKAADFVAT